MKVRMIGIAATVGALIFAGIAVARSGPGPAAPQRAPKPHIPLLGAAVNLPFLQSADTRYAATLRGVYRSLTPENEMKMDTVEPERGQFDFAAADTIVAFAQANGMRVRGHTLVWGKQLPGWLEEGTWTAGELKQILVNHIQAEVGHFRGSVRVWDVVNEPIADDGSGRFEPNLWYRVLGPDYIAIALRAARRADPTAKLFINEFNTDRNGAKVDALLRLVKRLKAQRVPLNGIGFQAHVRLDSYPSASELTKIMRRFTRLGLRVEVTELDVPLGASAPLDQLLAAQARVYAQIGSACRQVTACDAITTWGFTDASTWLGTDQRPLPFAADYTPKPAFFSLVKAAGARSTVPQP
jgi:endo-1,4-beta-xylanase